MQPVEKKDQESEKTEDEMKYGEIVRDHQKTICRK